MNADKEEQEDELLALHSILGSEEFVRDESKSAGEIRVSVELPADFTVTLKEGETLRQYEISFLPPLRLTFELPEDYPSSSPPSFTLTCSWLTQTQLSALAAQLADLYQATGGAVVLFTWVQFLKEDAPRFLDIHTLLELPSDEHSTQDNSQDSLEPKNTKHTPEAGPTDNQSINVSDPREPDLSASSLEVEHPTLSSTDSQGAVALDSCNLPQNNLTSHHSEVTQDGPNSGPNADYQKTSNNSNTREAEQTLQTSELEADYQNEPTSEPLQFAQSDPSNEGSVSGSSLLPSSSSDPLDESEQGAASLPIHPRESPQTLSVLCLTPSQTLLSQLLIYDAAQQQKQFATTVFDCGVCFVGWLGLDCVQLPECGHIFCQACLAQLCKLQITEGNVRGVTCPQAECTATPTPAQVKSLVGEELFSRYDRLLLQNTLDCMPDVTYCPRRSCASAVIQDKSSNAAMCSVCGFAFCVICKKTYHGKDNCQEKKKNVIKRTGKDAQQASVDLPQSQEGIRALWDDYASGSKQRQHLLESRYGRKILQVTVEASLSEDWITSNSKSCPHCFCRIQKDSGCNKMTCSRCRRLFCWACLARLSYSNPLAHFQDSACFLYTYNQT
ncbi:E3 ubiquitin-protein ligase RNF14-like [Morone saxatilis]|uniref:E3 ubiquitin-protein ligase RNF14-like n=1 Tax=Morone saxatilis TaxID=34816 RepID=UPI0015E25644|nr:E3 ubiquitin-protein ligase RNF14-like [Morone saxatilis]